MANHVSSEKRARQTPKRHARNMSVKSRVHNAERAVRAATTDAKKAAEALSGAFSALQKASGVLHRNTVRRKMARLSKAVARVSK